MALAWSTAAWSVDGRRVRVGTCDFPRGRGSTQTPTKILPPMLNAVHANEARGVGSCRPLRPQHRRIAIPPMAAQSHGPPTMLSAEKAIPPQPRFVVRNLPDQLRASIFTWWDLLDRQMEAASGSSPSKWMYGYLRPGRQLDAYIRAVQQRGVKRYCEIGINGGHGTVAMLLANPGIDVVAFDLAAYPFSTAVYDLLLTSFPGRIRIFKGNSHGDHDEQRWRLANLREPPRCGDNNTGTGSSDDGSSSSSAGVYGSSHGTAACFAAEVLAHRENACDVVLVDGDHAESGTLADIANMAHASSCAPHARLLVDDTDRGLRVDSGRAVARACATGLITLEEHAWFNHTHRASHNPCLRNGWSRLVDAKGEGARTPRFTRPLCVNDWGFVTARYRAPPMCRRSKPRRGQQ